MAKYPKQTVYYKTVADDFGTDGLCGKKIDRNYVYIKKSLGFRLLSFLLRRILIVLPAYFYTKIILRERIIGKRRLRLRGGFVIYANHTQTVGDAFSPNTAVFPRKLYTVVHPDNLSIPVFGKLIPYMGALPTPSDLRAAHNFSAAADSLLRDGKVICVYPEAHVWPYYTGIRPFTPGAFDIAVRCGAPVFSYTRVYKKSRLFGFRCRIYVDGPFYPNPELSRSLAERELSEKVFSVMTERARENDVQVIKYERKTDCD